MSPPWLVLLKQLDLPLRFLIDKNSPLRIAERQISELDLITGVKGNIPYLSTRTITRDLHKLHDRMLPHIRRLFDTPIASGGKAHIAFDGWTSSNEVPYLGIAAHWLESDFATMHDIVLDTPASTDLIRQPILQMLTLQQVISVLVQRLVAGQR